MPVKPFCFMTQEEKSRLYNQAMQKTVAFAVEKLGVPVSEVALRELSPGDESAAADGTLIDVDWKTAPAAADAESWTEDSADLTAAALSSVLVANEQVNENTCITIYGFSDNTPDPDLTMLQLMNGSEKVMSAQVEHCYIEAPYGGFFVDNKGDVIICKWAPKDYIKWYLACKTAADKNVVLLGFTAEIKGKNITVSLLK